jgi:hypothetical protein
MAGAKDQRLQRGALPWGKLTQAFYSVEPGIFRPHAKSPPAGEVPRLLIS